MRSIDVTQNPRVLLEFPRENPVSVMGLRIGQRSLDIPNHIIERGCPDNAQGSIKRLEDGTYQRRWPEDDEYFEYPLEEQIQDVHEEDGVFVLKTSDDTHLDLVEVHVRNARIKTFSMSGTFIKDLQLDNIDSALSHLGPTDYRYRDKGLSLGWPNRLLQILFVDSPKAVTLYFGDVDLYPYTVTAISLLRASLQWDLFHTHRPLPETAAYRKSQIITQRLQALLDAYAIGRSHDPLRIRVRQFFDGDFIDTYSEDKFLKISRFLSDPGNGLPQQLLRSEYIKGPSELRWFWLQTINFRQQLEPLLQPTDEEERALQGVENLYHSIKIHAQQKLSSIHNHLDEALAIIVDPDQRHFTWGRLIRDFSFPDRDLNE